MELKTKKMNGKKLYKTKFIHNDKTVAYTIHDNGWKHTLHFERKTIDVAYNYPYACSLNMLFFKSYENYGELFAIECGEVPRLLNHAEIMTNELIIKSKDFKNVLKEFYYNSRDVVPIVSADCRAFVCSSISPKLEPANTYDVRILNDDGKSLQCERFYYVTSIKLDTVNKTILVRCLSAANASLEFCDFKIEIGLNANFTQSTVRDLDLYEYKTGHRLIEILPISQTEKEFEIK